MNNWKRYITTDPKILSGKPVIKGTRISVDFILERLTSGWSETDILENYPNLTKESIRAIYSFAFEKKAKDTELANFLNRIFDEDKELLKRLSE